VHAANLLLLSAVANAAVSVCARRIPPAKTIEPLLCTATTTAAHTAF